MKNYIFIITILILTAVSPSLAYALTPAPTSANSQVKEKLDEQINELKEKIASRVSELNLVEKRGVIATVSEVKGNQITMTDVQGNTRFADVDELTKFSSAATKSFGLSDLTKGSMISIVGNYNKQSKRILARFVNAYTSPTFYTGTISQINAKDFQITILTKEQKPVGVDINPPTRLTSYTLANGITRLGFAKLTVGDRVLVVGAPSKTLPNMLAATRIIVYADSMKDTTVVTTSPTSAATSPTVLPSAAGNKNLNPVR